MSNNTLRPVLRAGRAARLEAPIRTTPIQTRCFSASPPSQLQNVIKFRGKSSNEELDTLLQDLQRKVILPSYLSIPLQKKIFRTRYKTKLDLEPIEIEVDGKPYKFRHIDNVPNSKKSLFKALDLMQTKADWAKLPKLLEGLWYHAQRKFEPGDWPRIIRKAGAAGNLAPIYEACQKPARTGMYLTRSETAQELMSAVVWQVTGAGWGEHATAQAVRNATGVVALLQEEAHQLTGLAKSEFEKTGMHPLKRDPQMMAHPVLFAAAMIVMHGRREEYLPVLKKYGELMLERWPAGKGLLEVHPNAAYVDPKGVEYLMEKGKFLIVASPILKGFELAVEALGSDPMADQIRPLRDAMASEVQSALAAEGHKNARGLQMHERVTAEHPTPKPAKPAKPVEAKSEEAEAGVEA